MVYWNYSLDNLNVSRSCKSARFRTGYQDFATIELARALSHVFNSILTWRDRKFETTHISLGITRASWEARGDVARSRSRISRDRRQLTKSRRGETTRRSRDAMTAVNFPGNRRSREMGHGCINFIPVAIQWHNRRQDGGKGIRHAREPW